jgi:PAS domain S-box-containing protein
MAKKTPHPPKPGAALTDHETIVRLAMEGVRMGTWVRNVVNNVVTWSPELEAIFGFDPGAFPGTEAAFRELVHPEDRSALDAAVQRAIASHSDYLVEFRFRHPSGEWRWMDDRGKVIYDASGNPLRLYGVGLDITERKRAELARAHLAAIVESSEDAIVSKTLDGYVTSWNAGAVLLFGYSSDEMIDQSITRIIPPELLYEEEEILSKLRRGERIEHYETERVSKDGGRVNVSLSVSPVRDSHGQIVGVSKIARNITHRKRTERALQESEARLRKIAAEREHLLESERAARSDAERLSHVKDEFLATLSHELRTPLNAIQGWTTLLRKSDLNDDDRARGLETIERNVRAQTQIVNDLLDMNRILSGKLHLDVKPVDLVDVIQSAIDAMRPSADAKRVRITPMLDSRIGLARGDPNRLQQVLWNLLTNAVKFTPAHGQIQIILERVGSHIEIVVEDSGAGIKPEFLPFVFDRFRQADPSTTRHHGGLGLGLSIVKNIVELHGGNVRVSSRGDDQGTKFVVSLPLFATMEAEENWSLKLPTLEAAAGDAIESPRLDGIAVLVVDDEADARELIGRILEGRGARALCVDGVAAALETLGRERVDVLLSDIGMPQEDGYELINRVRRLDAPHVRRIPAIAVTAYARPEDRHRSLLAGYQMHIPKPIEASELIAGIAGLVNVAR